MRGDDAMAALTFDAALAVVHKFDPSEARDKDGKWTLGGAIDRALSPYDTFGVPGGPGAKPHLPETGGVAFASPSVTDKNFDQAKEALGGERQRRFAAAGQDIDNALGLQGEHAGVVGAWADGAENSTMTEASNRDGEALRLSAAMKGWLGEQKAVLVFNPDKAGPAALYDMQVTDAPEDAHAALLKAGVPFHTLIPTDRGTRILVVDTDGALGQHVGDFAVAHGTQAMRTTGHAEFIGDDKGTGSDDEQRARARSAYEHVISSSASRYQGRSAGELWNGLRDRWRGRIEAVKRAIMGFGAALAALQVVEKYSPDQQRDNDGRWTNGGGEDKSGTDGPGLGPGMRESIDEDITYERMAAALTGDGIHAEGPYQSKQVKGAWIEESPLQTTDAVYAGADANKRKLDTVGDQVAKEVDGVQWRSPGIKKLPRVLEKSSLEKMAEGRSAAGVTDIVRGTIVADTPEAADKAVQVLGRYFPTTDEGYKETSVGYFDRAVNVRFANGQIGEVLIAPPDLVAAKGAGGGGHDLYKQWRALPADDPQGAVLAQKQRDLYGAARERLSPQWKAVLGKAGSLSPAKS